MNRFEKWVRNIGGPTAVATRLGVSRQTVNNWLSGRSTPNAKTLNKILALTKGRVSLVNILACGVRK